MRFFFIFPTGYEPPIEMCEGEDRFVSELTSLFGLHLVFYA